MTLLRNHTESKIRTSMYLEFSDLVHKGTRVHKKDDTGLSKLFTGYRKHDQ